MADCLLSRWEMYFELQVRCRNTLGHGFALNVSLTNCLIQTFIREEHGVTLNLIFQPLACSLPVHTTHLEYVREVGGKGYAEWQRQSGKAIIDDRELLIADFMP